VVASMAPEDPSRTARTEPSERAGQTARACQRHGHAFRDRAARDIFEDAVALRGRERIELEIEGLISGANPGISDKHAGIVSQNRQECKKQRR